MADNLLIVPIPANTWVDLYAETGIAVGSVLQVENSGANDIYLAVQELEPAKDHKSYNVIKRPPSVNMQNSDGDLGAWAYSGNTGGQLSISSPLKEGFLPTISSNLHDGFGNPIFSFKGALSTYDSDVNSIMVNEHLRQNTGITDTLGAPASIDDRDITVTNGGLFTVNDRITLAEGTLRESATIKITAVAGNVLSMDKPLEHDYTIAAIVTGVIKSLNVNGSVTPQIFQIAPPADEIWHIYRMTIAMVHTTVSSDDLFGNLTKLANGLVMRQINGFRHNLTVWRDNSDIIEDTGVDLRYSSKSGGGLFGTAARWTFKRAGTVVTLDGSKGDKFQAIVQDNLSQATMKDIEIKVQGHVEGV